MAKKSKSKFDPEAFLAKADGGVTIANYKKGQVVFAQGEPADSVFYILEGRIKIAASGWAIQRPRSRQRVFIPRQMNHCDDSH